MTVLLETALSLHYYKVQFMGEKPPGSHGKKKQKVMQLRATLETSILFRGRVPEIATLDKWLDGDGDTAQSCCHLPPLPPQTARMGSSRTRPPSSGRSGGR